MMGPRIISRALAGQLLRLRRLRYASRLTDLAHQADRLAQGGGSHCQFHHNGMVRLDSADAMAITQMFV